MPVGRRTVRIQNDNTFIRDFSTRRTKKWRREVDTKVTGGYMAKGQQEIEKTAGRGSGEETGRGSGGAERARNGREGDMSDLSK